MNFHYHLLINEAAGSGNGKKTAEKILPILDKKQLSYTAHYSEYKGHDALIAEQLAKDTLMEWEAEQVTDSLGWFPLLIVVGGDGTLHQVLNTFHQLCVSFPVGFIPAGSGNDFARGIGISRDPEKALEAILSTNEPQEINVLHYEEKVSDREGLALNNFGIGLDAAIVHATNHSNAKKRLNKYNLGSLSYLFSLLHVLFTQKGFPILVDIGGKRVNFKKAFLCTATNHPYFGGGISIVPTADITKPTIDFVVVERINLLKIIWLFLLLLQKKQMNSKYFHHYTTSKLRIVSTIPQYGQEDGEDLEKQSFDLQLANKTQLLWCKKIVIREEGPNS
ncbi:YegS/Rv2252/BmrU family lipid kinase [Enterococcus sp. DIV1298c]|uniref:diacylglycerol/lipid kinase family protein n=1 Tax=Enterococcus sp. DIV1298c TaxID=2815328 RepID=UPI001A90FA8E|nr:YegS/Rv2252/BmrU family lipid kinase [Enterococcus sp. DIV1298c]MBO0461242.1 YegS/Rv2252/BmrU family lipid kinase [Enterococcus sp. DIV1298c]